MHIDSLHQWLGEASGGAGPVLRWLWACSIVVAIVGFAYVASLALS